MSDDVFVLVELGNPALFFQSSVDLFFLLHNMTFRFAFLHCRYYRVQMSL